MSTYAVLIAYFAAVLASGQVKSALGARDPARMTERGSMTLMWLARHPRPGTPSSRRRVAVTAHREIFRGLRLAGVYSPLLCLHSHEGAWNSNTGNGYWGGLQFDSGFYHYYGHEYARLWGTPDRWPVWSQMNAAYRAYRERGWEPWGTRGLCGL